jgi:hypothetical protein
MRSRHRRLAAAAVAAGAMLATAAPANAEVLVDPFSFSGNAIVDFHSGGDNVRVFYRCTSRKGGFIDMRNLDQNFRRFARPRCDGAPRSVLMRVLPQREMTLHFTQGSEAHGAIRIEGAPLFPGLD